MTRRARIPALALDDLEAWLAGQPDIARRNSPAVREVVRWPEKVCDFGWGVTERGLGLLR